MDKEEIDAEVAKSLDHSLVKTFPVGNILTLIIALLAVAVGWGSNRADIVNLQRDIQLMTTRDMTPGAAANVAAIRARDDAQDQQIKEIRADLRDSRREILDELRALRMDLQDHTKGK